MAWAVEGTRREGEGFKPEGVLEDWRWVSRRLPCGDAIYVDLALGASLGQKFAEEKKKPCKPASGMQRDATADGRASRLRGRVAMHEHLALPLLLRAILAAG